MSETDQTTVKEIFEKMMGESKKAIQLEALPADEMPVSLTQNEFMRRMADMSKMGGGQPWMANMPSTHNVVINTNHPAIAKLLKADADTQGQQAKQLYDLALLSQNLLVGADLTRFVQEMVGKI